MKKTVKFVEKCLNQTSKEGINAGEKLWTNIQLVEQVLNQTLLPIRMLILYSR